MGQPHFSEAFSVDIFSTRDTLLKRDSKTDFYEDGEPGSEVSHMQYAFQQLGVNGKDRFFTNFQNESSFGFVIHK